MSDIDITEQADGTLYADVLDHGHVVLEKWMGSDLEIVNNARVSFDQESDELGERELGLINFLVRERHTSPLEAVTLRFDIKAPIFVFRQHHRHRTQSYNEQSMRYSEANPQFYVPSRDKVRSQVGKPGAYTFETIEDDSLANQMRASMLGYQQAAFDEYQRLVELGMAKELARTILPVGMYSRMKATLNLLNAMRFCKLRNDEHAQYEIRIYAEVMERMLHRVAPVTMEAWERHGRIV